MGLKMNGTVWATKATEVKNTTQESDLRSMSSTCKSHSYSLSN